MSRLYGYPDLGRFGLGHSLLAWARCVVWCKDHDVPMLAPRWLRLRIGPYLRGERDKREYFKLFNNRGYIGEPRRSYLLTAARKVVVKDIAVGREGLAGPNLTVAIFRNAIASNFETYFHQVKGRGFELHQELCRITRKRYRAKKPPEPFLAVHVRLGDFSPTVAHLIEAGRHNQRLPIHWYCDALTGLREGLGFAAPVRVYSDGHDRELAPLLAMKEVYRAPQAESITHLLEMAAGGALISTGSGFSLWSAFFGQMPRITYPNQSIVTVHNDASLDVSFDGVEPYPITLLDAVRAGLAVPPIATSND